MRESRVQFLEQNLSILGFHRALDALDWVRQEMCAEKGYKRHNGSHYYYHLVDTTQDLLNHGVRDENTIVACLLHDIVEDVPGVTLKMLADRYNEDVAHIVDLVTKKKGLNYREYPVMKSYLRGILGDWRACLIKTADRKHNFSTLMDATAEKKLRQANETEQLFIPFFKECRTKYPRYAAYFFSAKTAIEPHMWEIQERYKVEEKLVLKLQRLEAKTQ